MKLIDASLIITVLLLAWALYRSHKSPALTFDLLDLLIENGRVSKIAFAFLTTLGATTWIIIRLTLDGKLTEGYFAGYGAVWIAPIIAKLFNSPPADKVTP